MEARIQKVSGPANCFWGVIARDVTGGIVHCCIAVDRGTPQVGDELTVYYRGGALSGLDLNGKDVFRR